MSEQKSWLRPALAGAAAGLVNGLFGGGGGTVLLPVLTVHDSLVFYVPEDKVLEAGRLIKALMEKQPFPEFDVPLVAEVAAGPNYGELDEW